MKTKNTMTFDVEQSEITTTTSKGDKLLFTGLTIDEMETIQSALEKTFGDEETLIASKFEKMISHYPEPHYKRKKPISDGILRLDSSSM